MPLNIKLKNFEGPFDLLLHLIKENKMDIYDIKIYDITSQYLDYLDKIKDIDLEVTSEFIVMAATLLEIKSKMLLPTIYKMEKEEEEEDPREELITKLLEYKKFKLAADFLGEREDVAGITFRKKPEIIEDKKEDIKDIFKNITMLELFNIYIDLIDKYNNKVNRSNAMQGQILLDKYKIEDKMQELGSIIEKKKNTSFTKIVKRCRDKMEVVVTFLALLELIRLKEVSAIQEKNFKEIYIERINRDEG